MNCNPAARCTASFRSCFVPLADSQRDGNANSADASKLCARHESVKRWPFHTSQDYPSAYQNPEPHDKRMCPWVCPQRCCNSIDSCLVFIKSSFAVISGNGTSPRSPWEGLGTITASQVSERNSLELIITTKLVSKLGCRYEGGKQVIKPANGRPQMRWTNSSYLSIPAI